MQRLSLLDDFINLQGRLIVDRDINIPTIVISAGTCGQASGANDLIRIIKKELLTKGWTEDIHLRITGCHGFCEMEPSMLIEPTRTFYPNVKLDDVAKIVEAVYKGTVVDKLLFVDPETGNPIEKQDDIPFYKRQTRTILGRNEKVDPIRIYTYIENGGYSALAKILEKKNQDWIIDEVKTSGLRGRGGAGFPTGLKWQMLKAQTNGSGKYLVCNADEGDPGAYMDRSILEGNPHSIIEGMIIGAYGTGATDGVIYVRNEYPLAIKHLIIALRQARDLGFLGENILGTGFSFDIKLVKGAGAFVCGEETALMRSVQGLRGEPRQRPPFPIEKGIGNKPTAINNVETWANIPIIFSSKALEFKQIGTKDNSGTKIFSLVGKVKYTGLVEVPMGTPIKDIIYDIGGGPVGKTKIKAVQTGGPSGGCIPTNMFDLPIDYDSLTKAGSIMGSGGMIVMDDNTCMVDVAKYFMTFLKDESCGKCFTCRKGTQRMFEILDDITSGKGNIKQLDLLKELGEVVKDTSMCGLGQTAANPVLSTMKYFHEEYKRHIVDKRCDAFVCKDLVGAPCQSACPLDTEAWRYIAHIQRGEYEDAYRVIRKPNPFPSVCARVCHHPCESKCRLGTSGGEAIAIRALKRFITDRMDPSFYQPKLKKDIGTNDLKVAVIGAGPAGLTAAHYLSLNGYQVTVIEAEDEAGGMLISCIPTYRLPREIVKREIESIIGNNIIMKYETVFGEDTDIEKLFKEGFKAIFVAIGAHQSMRLGLKGEDSDGVYPSIQFLKSFNLKGEELAKGYVGVIGGGNAAVDAARVALRQKDVKGVTIFYRRTRQEMPAFIEEVSAALEEGINFEVLVSPINIHTDDGKLVSIDLIRNKLGDIDTSGRRRPVSVPDTEFNVKLDTLIVAISERPDSVPLEKMGIKLDNHGLPIVEKNTLRTNIDGVFAGGDLVTGPNTVVEAIAVGKKVADVIHRYLNKQSLIAPPESLLPEYYIPSFEISDAEEVEEVPRVKIPRVPAESRKNNFIEVEKVLSIKEAREEAQRCLRCDLEFTQQEENKEKVVAEESKGI